MTCLGIIIIHRPKPRKKRAAVSNRAVEIHQEPEPEARSDPIIDDNDDLFDVFEIDRTAPF